jgi:hypothetical protein
MNKSFRSAFIVPNRRFFAVRREDRPPSAAIFEPRTLERIQTAQITSVRGFVETTDPASRRGIWLDIPPVKQTVATRDNRAVSIYRRDGDASPFLSIILTDDSAEAQKALAELVDLEKARFVTNPMLDLRDAFDRIGAAVTPLDTGRTLNRLERAEILRGWFKLNGFPLLSVTTPHYAGATAVEVALPHSHDRALIDNMHRRLSELLATLFPNHRNRPDPDSDYYGYLAWSIK